MSTWRAIGSVIGRTVRGLTERVLSVYSRWGVVSPTTAARLTTKLVQQAPSIGRVPAARIGGVRPTQRPFSFFTRLLSRSANVSARTALRAATIAHRHIHHRPHTFAAPPRPTQFLADVKSLLHRVTSASGEDGSSADDLAADQFPQDINAYDVADYICHGCNGAVYSASVKHNNLFPPPAPNSLVSSTEPLMAHLAKALGTSPAAAATAPQAQLSGSPLVIKLLFNYNYFASPNQIWWSNEAEVVPVIDKRLHGTFNSCRALCRTRPHVNIIKMYTAFVDEMKLLPGAQELYPAALPPDLAMTGHAPLSTMYIVLKRYKMTLREYVLWREPCALAAHVMFAQLLEAAAFLFERQCSHRDLKSDNILLDFNDEDEPPYLVVSDFGSCMASGSLQLTYFSSDCDLGGNVCLRPPEVRRAQPSPHTQLDYSASDLWACGTLGYEMFTRMNPFYSTLHSDAYSMEQLPPLPAKVPAVVQSLITHILNVQPAQRPAVSTAATVCVLALMRAGSELNTLLYSIARHVTSQVASMKHITLDPAILRSSYSYLNGMVFQSRKLTDDFLALFAVETLMGHRLAGSISGAEAQVRHTCLARLDYAALQQAIQLLNAYNKAAHRNLLSADS